MHRFLLFILLAFSTGCRTTPKNGILSPVQVLVIFTINEKGTTEDMHVVSSPSRELSADAIASVKKWSFEPAVENVIPVKNTVEYLITFRSEGSFKYQPKPDKASLIFNGNQRN